jgi:nucleoside-diphosphate-sugar epimerase
VNGGRALTDITYIENLVEAVRLALQAEPKAWNQAYNITNDEPMTVRDWFEGMLQELNREFLPLTIPRSVAMAMGMAAELASRLRLVPDSPPITRFSAGYMGTSMTLSTQKAKSLLGYSPAIGNVEGFRRTGLWWSQNRAEEVPKHD